MFQRILLGNTFQHTPMDLDNSGLEVGKIMYLMAYIDNRRWYEYSLTWIIILYLLVGITGFIMGIYKGRSVKPACAYLKTIEQPLTPLAPPPQYTDDRPAQYASWYDEESCRREQGLPEDAILYMANGEVLDDEVYTCAIWDKEFGTILVVTNIDTGTKVEVEVTDRGPTKRLVRQGRIIDLTRRAFKEIAPLSQGLCRVRMEKIQQEMGGEG